RQKWGALLEAAAEQAVEIACREPASRFLELIAAAISNGRVYLTGNDGLKPVDPGAWGWRARESQGKQDDADLCYYPLGNPIGWVKGDDVFLDPEASFAEVQRLGEEQGERLPLTKLQLHRRLKEQGCLASTETDRDTVRRSFQGRERSFLHLRISYLSPQKPGIPGEARRNSEKHGEN